MRSKDTMSDRRRSALLDSIFTVFTLARFLLDHNPPLKWCLFMVQVFHVFFMYRLVDVCCELAVEE